MKLASWSIRLAVCLAICLLAACVGGPKTPVPAAPEAEETAAVAEPAQPEPPPEDAASLRRQAADALAAGQLALAQERSARALELEPYQPESLLLRARVLAASGTWPQALRLLELEPMARLAEAILLRAEILAVQAREEQQALELLRGARNSRDARLPELEGRILLGAGRESEGREALLRALELEPDREPALRLLLEQAVRAEHWEEAAGYLERLNAAEGSETDLLLAYRAQARLGRTEQALAFAARLYAARPEAYAVEYASALLESGDWEQALRVVDQHLAAPAPLLSSRLLVIRADALQARDPDRAMDALQQALSLDPANFPALVRLGELYAARRDYRQARQYLRLALELDPTNAELSARLEGLNY
jgi:Tfp pilus assembly protein PilF